MMMEDNSDAAQEKESGLLPVECWSDSSKWSVANMQKNIRSDTTPCRSCTGSQINRLGNGMEGLSSPRSQQAAMDARPQGTARHCRAAAPRNEQYAHLTQLEDTSHQQGLDSQFSPLRL